MILFVDLKLWLVKIVKSDVCEWRVFAEPVTYIDLSSLAYSNIGADHERRLFGVYPFYGLFTS